MILIILKFLMSFIHYKFKSAKDYDTLTFDGLSISVEELKLLIFEAKKLKESEFDLIITDAQTNEGSFIFI